MSFCQTDAFSIAVVGAGPTAVYFLNDLIKRAPGCSVTFFEAGEEAGRGMPYAMSHNDNGMLANIASIEIPPLRQTLSQWLSGLSDNIREEMGVSAHEDDEREFYPRVVLGRFFAAQFAMLVAAAEVQGFKVRVWDKTRVLDISPSASNVVIRYQGPTDEMCLKQFDAVMIATGHTWPGVTRDQAGVYHSPYPAWRLDHIHNCTVGIVGTGLSAIDAVYRIATNHGEFCAADHPDRLTYKPGRFAVARVPIVAPGSQDRTCCNWQTIATAGSLSGDGRALQNSFKQHWGRAGFLRGGAFSDGRQALYPGHHRLGGNG